MDDAAETPLYRIRIPPIQNPPATCGMAATETENSTDGTTTGDVKRAFDFSVSDFATIVTTAAYVDKTLMIRDVYNASSRILITAPPRFGKSTNMDMVKRFFEIEVDAHGNPNPVHKTNNYKLFKDYNLEICKDIGFFKEHFGKHPVVYIDFKPLGRVVDSAKILKTLKIVTENSFNEHTYILQSSRTEDEEEEEEEEEDVFNGITGFDENYFRKYACGGITKIVDDVTLASSFKHLSTILKKFFGKKVFVMIDSYDAFLESPVFKNNNGEKMKLFVESSMGQLLNNINCVERVLITGVIPVLGEGLLCSESNIERYHFLDSHAFTKYYGLTSAEVDTVLSKVIECDEERRDVRNTINDYYNAYETCNRDIRVYNVFSVLEYVCRRTTKSYWCDRMYMNKFKICFKIEQIRLKLEDLLLGNELQVDISQPLSIADVLKVNSMITRGEAESTEVELFVVLLYHFGYLSVINDLGMGVVCITIASEEIKYELAKAVCDENRQLYSSPYMNGILSALNAFQPDDTGVDKNCETLSKNMYSLYLNIRFPIGKIIEFLYVNLVTSAKYRRVIGRKLGPNGPTAVLLMNRNQVAICVTYDGYESSESVHQKVTSNSGEEHIFEVFNDVRGKVIIAIDCAGTIAYSYYFKTGDNLREVTILSQIHTQ